SGTTEALLRSYRTGLGLLGQRVQVAAGGTEHHGILSAIDFATLELDGRLRLPLGGVRSLR
ncbi:MAG: hypothetical protein JNK49_08075, partial [Planctomycetes bacterium]|nr:hypothetical protein [Planctomycetota bacterium]